MMSKGLFNRSSRKTLGYVMLALTKVLLDSRILTPRLIKDEGSCAI